jgi:hypothetical protein
MHPRSLLNPLLHRQDFNETTTKVIESISFLLGELHDIRDKYMLKTLPFDAHRVSAPARSLPPRPDTLRLRAWANQKHKSVFAVALWALRDERRFDKKVKRLGEMITGLEDITRAGDRPLNFDSQAILSGLLGQDDIPPPYSLAAYRSTSWAVRVPPADVDSPSTGTFHVNDMAEVTTTSMHRYLFAMDAYLASFPPGSAHTGPNARDKLRELSHYQFSELCTDVYDELLRRQEYQEPNSESLPERPSLHLQRNQARKKLSTLVTLRLGQLVEDIASEIKRRYPYLQYFSSSISTSHTIIPPPARPSERRSSVVGTRCNTTDPSPDALRSQTADTRTQDKSDLSHDNSNTSLLVSYRVKMDDLCSVVLPAVLQKYGITAPSEAYSLYIAYDEEERRVEMHEKPLLLFKTLNKAGKKPMFMLRKEAPPAAVSE